MASAGPRASVLGLLRAGRYVDDVLARHPHPPVEGRTTVIGPDPLRVLLVGAGTALGYGVTERSHALDGRLAPVLAQRTGRGVIVDTRIRQDLRLEDTVDLLGASGAQTYHAVVWSPTFREIVRVATVRRWRRLIDLILAHLRSTGTTSTGVVLLGLPRVEPIDRMQALIVRRLTLIDSRIEVASRNRSGMRYSAVEPLGRIEDLGRVFDAEYYDRCAHRVAEAVLEVLPSFSRSS